jgi:DNA polymerase-1
MYGSYYDNFALEDLVRRYFDVYLDKSMQKEFEKATELSEPLVKYACLDSLYTRKIALKQRELIDRNDFDIWTKIDRPAMWALMAFQGFPIDVEKWLALSELNYRRRDEIDAELPINPRSPKQVVEYLSKNGFSGLKSSGEAKLNSFIKKKPNTKAAAVAKKVLDSRKYGKLAGTYGKKMIDRYVEYDKNGVARIHSNFDPNRAETGRTASSDPNLQNIPARDTKEFRECFIPSPGNALVIADYSAQEPRVTAYLSQDKKIMQIFRDGKDIYDEMRDLIGISGLSRDNMKTVFLGMTYGLSKYGLAGRLGVSKDEAGEILHKVFRTFPGVANWMNKQHKEKKYVSTVAGRRCWINPYNSQSTERNSLNSPVQGTAGDMLKIAFATMYEEWDFDYPYGVVNEVHDELVEDVPEPIAEDVAQFTTEVMVNVAEEMCPGMPFKAEAKIASTWAGK